jgi:hypothetical protein
LYHTLEGATLPRRYEKTIYNILSDEPKTGALTPPDYSNESFKPSVEVAYEKPPRKRHINKGDCLTSR